MGAAVGRRPRASRSVYMSREHGGGSDWAGRGGDRECRAGWRRGSCHRRARTKPVPPWFPPPDARPGPLPPRPGRAAAGGERGRSLKLALHGPAAPVRVRDLAIGVSITSTCSRPDCEPRSCVARHFTNSLLDLRLRPPSDPAAAAAEGGMQGYAYPPPASLGGDVRSGQHACRGIEPLRHAPLTQRLCDPQSRRGGGDRYGGGGDRYR